MQVSWIVKGPPAGPADSHLPTYFFFPQFFSSPSPDGGQAVACPCLSGRLIPPPLPLPPGKAFLQYPNRCLAATATRQVHGAATLFCRSCQVPLLVPWQPWCQGRTNERATKSLSLSCECESVSVRRPPHFCLPLLLPPSSPSSPVVQLLPPARLPLSDKSSPTQTQPRPPPTHHATFHHPHAHTFPALPYGNHSPHRTVPLARPAVPSHPNPIPSIPSSSFTVLHFPFTCAAQPNSEPSIHPFTHPSSLPLPLCTNVLYCIALAPAYLTLCASVTPPGRNSAAAHVQYIHTRPKTRQTDA